MSIRAQIPMNPWKAARIRLESERAKGPPLCACGCRQPVKWRPHVGWNTYIRGHHKKKQTTRPPRPLCACGCRQPVAWSKRTLSWGTYIKGHSRKNKPMAPEHKLKIRDASIQRYAGKRRRDQNPTGPGVYSSHEYKGARAELIDGKPCQNCGATDNIHAHHQIPGDDSSLIPLCSKCHPTAHAKPGAKGALPPENEKAPLCACGCGRPVKWKRVRGWATYCKGHGNAKVPAVGLTQTPPKCACGCGKPVSFRNGKGWNKYRRGHGQRIEGHYTSKRK